jgi:hypothetical protein
MSVSAGVHHARDDPVVDRHVDPVRTRIEEGLVSNSTAAATETAMT